MISLPYNATKSDTKVKTALHIHAPLPPFNTDTMVGFFSREDTNGKKMQACWSTMIHQIVAFGRVRKKGRRGDERASGSERLLQKSSLAFRS